MSTLLALMITLLVLIILVGGKTGLKSYLSIVINTCLIILVGLLVAWGINIFWIGVVFIPLKLLTIIYLGTHDYSLAKNSFLTALVVSIVVIVVILILQTFAQSAGFGDQASEELVGLSVNVGISFPQIAIIVAIFSTLGAIAEASVAISAGLFELKHHDPTINKETILKHGNLLGKDVLSTALNTILFGMFGSFLPLFIWYIRLNYSLFQILNDKLFISESLIIIYSFIGVLLTVPLTTHLLAHTLTQSKKK